MAVRWLHIEEALSVCLSVRSVTHERFNGSGCNLQMSQVQNNLKSGKILFFLLFLRDINIFLPTSVFSDDDFKYDNKSFVFNNFSGKSKIDTNIFEGADEIKKIVTIRSHLIFSQFSQFLINDIDDADHS